MTYASDLRRFAGTLTATALGIVALVSCAAAQRPATGGIELGTYLARFSGQWTLDRDASDDPARAIEATVGEGTPDGERGGGGHAPGHGGGQGGGAGGHGRDGHGTGGVLGAGRPNPDALEATFEVFRAVPDRFTLTVTDALSMTTWAGVREARIPIAGAAIPVTVQGRQIEVRAKWDGGKLQIERRIDGGGKVIDLVEGVPRGDRLIVRRTIRGVPGATPEIRLVFDRAE
jgi:hypothetical protein